MQAYLNTDDFFFPRYRSNPGVGAQTVGDRDLYSFGRYVEMSGALPRRGLETSRQPEVTGNEYRFKR